MPRSSSIAVIISTVSSLSTNFLWWFVFILLNVVKLGCSWNPWWTLSFTYGSAVVVQGRRYGLLLSIISHQIRSDETASPRKVLCILIVWYMMHAWYSRLCYILNWVWRCEWTIIAEILLDLQLISPVTISTNLLEISGRAFTMSGKSPTLCFEV